MSAHTLSTHFSRHLLLDYFRHNLPEGKELQIEEHLADCEGCVQLARRVRQFVEFFDPQPRKTSKVTNVPAKTGKTPVLPCGARGVHTR